MNAALPPLVQEHGVPFDVFIQALTEQLDKAQAAMAVKARVAKLPLTFAVKDVSLDLRAFVTVIDDDIYIRPAQPGDAEASTIKLGLTTITKPMIEENAVDFAADEPRFSIREALRDTISEEDQRKLERIGVRDIRQLTALKKAAGADVIARLSRMPVNRLQQALLRAAAPRVTEVEPHPPEPPPVPQEEAPVPETPARLSLRGINLVKNGRLPVMRVGGRQIPIVRAQEHELVIEPNPSDFGEYADIDFGNGETLSVALRIEDDPNRGVTL